MVLCYFVSEYLYTIGEHILKIFFNILVIVGIIIFATFGGKGNVKLY